MGFFGKILDATINVALTPVDVVKDVVTMGGVLDGQEETYTAQRLKKAVKKVEQAGDDAGDGEWL